uniref:Uncharacterized protein n=1 Tax=Panagrolaimus sp. JU765 TaxID=591449 RepID=A0AC34RSN5_9BILA
MSLLVDRVMDSDFRKKSNNCFSGVTVAGKKRKNNDFDESQYLIPVKMTKKEVAVQDVKSCDITCSFDVDSERLSNLECSLEDGRLLIFIRRSDGRLERRCIILPEFLDPQSVCMCFDPDAPNHRLLIGFNYLPEYKIPRHLQ